MWVSRVLGDNDYIRMPRVTVVVARLRTPTSEWPWVPIIGQNLPPFTGNVNVSIWVKNFIMGRKTSKTQTNNQIYRMPISHGTIYTCKYAVSKLSPLLHVQGRKITVVTLHVRETSRIVYLYVTRRTHAL